MGEREEEMKEIDGNSRNEGNIISSVTIEASKRQISKRLEGASVYLSQHTVDLEIWSSMSNE